MMTIQESAIEKVRDCLKTVEDWAEDYVQSDDYGEGYAYLVSERLQQAMGRVETYCGENGIDCPACILDEVTSDLIDALECTYGSGYGMPSGIGCVLGSFPIDEHEEQVDIESHEIFLEYHEAGILTDILGKLDRDFCLSGHDDLSGEHSCFYMYVYLGGDAWYYHVSDETIRETILQAILSHCRRND